MEDWLIIGHVHYTYLNEDKKIASLAPFSIDIKNFSYGLLIDDEDASDLGITPDYSTDLLGKGKSGFNPFYTPPKEQSNSTSNR